jgi:hypothetical protein
MASTTNYNWSTPDDTALVKDGAAAIRTLGSSIDTTTKALNPSTTLGDIEYRSATANTNTRLAIGSTGNVLTVAGGVPTWAAPAGGGGKVLQVVETSTTTATASTSTSLADTTLTATITPTSASSKVLIIVAQWFEKTPGNVGAAVGTALLRGATQLNAGGSGANFYTDSSSRFRCCVSLLMLDSPATTSSTTYKTQFNSNVAGQTVNAQPDGYRSTIVLMEIGA